MSNARHWTRLFGMLALCVVAALVPAAARQSIAVELETSHLSVVNGVAEATFKVVVKNEEDVALTGVWLVFADGFEVAVGDIEPQASGASDSTTRTFDLSESAPTRAIPFAATLKYSAGAEAVEQKVNVVLHLTEEGR